VIVFFFIGTGDVNAKAGMVNHVLPDVKIPTDVECQVTVSRFMKRPDHALETIYSILEESHRIFFLSYKSDIDTSIPDVKEILDELKQSVLGGSTLVFSGLTPLQSRMDGSHWWRLAEQYGAQCHNDISSATTHVISYRVDTSKVLCAQQRGIPIVTPDWILESIFNWERQDEAAFRPPNLPKTPPLQTVNLKMDDFNKEIEEMLDEEDDEDDDDSSSSDSDFDDIPDVPSPKRQRLSDAEDDEIDDLAEELENDLFG
jgi:RNA polymerase II subunit A C-terminal domain phosphatase